MAVVVAGLSAIIAINHGWRGLEGAALVVLGFLLACAVVGVVYSVRRRWLR